MTQLSTQTEAQLEESLVQRLVRLGYEKVTLDSSHDLKSNLKRQLELHNKIELSQMEFNKVLNHLDKGNIFQKAKSLRDRFHLIRDDGSSCYIQFFNTLHWCQNQYQVTSQVTVLGKYENRYDVTLLINGLPLVQIELKRRGIELKEAFNQINRYQRHSYWADNGLFNYVQIFVISNGVNSKYYANNRKQEFKQTFFWTKEDNTRISQLDDFADHFLEKCHVSKMISKYIVLHESDKVLMALRPYQYYAVESIVERVKTGRKNGFIWHTTGSGKTLTSFKAAQILTELPKIHKVIFVVDRADLDYQTTKEFNHFSEGCVDGTDNTVSLVNQMAGDSPLIVTTIQKLNTAICKPKHETVMEQLRDKRIVFIFDECHRSQFGDTHKNILKFFVNAQMFGFTGTPIFPKNATTNEHGKRTTEDLFDECLHKYVITNAISDENVLKFSVEYWGKLKEKSGDLKDEKVNSLNTREFFESDKRIEDIVDWIIANHDRKTNNKHFSAMMCVGSKEALIKYYDTFKRKRESGAHDLRIATIFTYAANEEDADANGLIGDPDFDIKVDDVKNKHSREKLESYVEDYNKLYTTQHSVKDSKSFYTYYKDIAKRLKERDKESFQERDRVDILLVVNMFLTGFDAKKLNTLYVDKNLKYHGLIQAFSRTNRILGDLKSQGNIVCFRNLKENTDEAVRLFCDTSEHEKILMEPYEFYVEKFNSELCNVASLAESPASVDKLISEDDQLNFVKSFRALIRTLNKLKPFTDFQWLDLDITEQEFEDYKSKYLDIYDRTKTREAGASIIGEVDFELELIHRDEVNVAYILHLLSEIHQKHTKTGNSAQTETEIKSVLDMLGNEAQLRSKKDLIEKFVLEYIPTIAEGQSIEDIFVGYWNKEKREAIHEFCKAENLSKEHVYHLMDEYSFTGKEPLREQVFAALNFKPKLLDRKKIYERVLASLKDIIHRYEDDTGALSIGDVDGDYDSKSINALSHRLGDYDLYFTDEIIKSRQAIEIAKFKVVLDKPYEEEITSLAAYPVAKDILGRGIANESIFDEYLVLTSNFQNQLKESGFVFSSENHIETGTVFWTLSEARKGSVILEFALCMWALNKGVIKPTMEFLKNYKSAAEGLDRLRDDISTRFGSDKSVSDEDTVMIITENIEEEFKKIKKLH